MPVLHQTVTRVVATAGFISFLHPSIHPSIHLFLPSFHESSAARPLSVRTRSPTRASPAPNSNSCSGNSGFYFIPSSIHSSIYSSIPSFVPGIERCKATVCENQITHSCQSCTKHKQGDAVKCAMNKEISHLQALAKS